MAVVKLEKVKVKVPQLCPSLATPYIILFMEFNKLPFLFRQQVLLMF